jgi:transcriptional regulator with XRE-family HTH domain
VDNRDEIREFLASRRARITPAQAGLPFHGGGRRRVSGLRREEVALLAGVSIDHYTKLERGNLGGVSDSVLDAIATALQLDEAERAHLTNLAAAANTTRRPRRRLGKPQIRATVQQILDAMPTAPAYVRTGAATCWLRTGSGMPPVLRAVRGPRSAGQRGQVRVPQPAGPDVLRGLGYRGQRHGRRAAGRGWE